MRLGTRTKLPRRDHPFHTNRGGGSGLRSPIRSKSFRAGPKSFSGWPGVFSGWLEISSGWPENNCPPRNTLRSGLDLARNLFGLARNLFGLGSKSFRAGPKSFRARLFGLSPKSPARKRSGPAPSLKSDFNHSFCILGPDPDWDGIFSART